MKKKDVATLSSVLIILSLVSVIFAGVGYLGVDIWLASTQWLLVGSVIALFSIYLKM